MQADILTEVEALRSKIAACSGRGVEAHAAVTTAQPGSHLGSCGQAQPEYAAVLRGAEVWFYGTTRPASHTGWGKRTAERSSRGACTSMNTVGM
jgi:hypothetical protein